MDMSRYIKHTKLTLNLPPKYVVNYFNNILQTCF